ncbi:putative ferric-chelate reductase 1 isoform X2 [Pleurodeles waltl]|uniref:putative ferric-chelate reductase 1 isoform X2 n=1 Tax=Pleurodeles waltl TaxID=8319 RepID=UPI0037093DC7
MAELMDSPLCWMLGLMLPLHVCAYPNGKVQSACSSMTPEHGVTAQTSPAPFNITVNQTVYTPGDKIIVKIVSSSIPIEGFLLQARTAANGKSPLGSFEITGENMQTLNCTTANSAVSHTSDAEKPVVEVIWNAPSKSAGDIKMRATVVANKTIFWVDIEGPKLTYQLSVASGIMGPTLGTHIFCNLLAISVFKIPFLELLNV